MNSEEKKLYDIGIADFVLQSRQYLIAKTIARVVILQIGLINYIV